MFWTILEGSLTQMHRIPKKHTSFLFQKLYACTSAPGSICQSFGLLLATDHLNFRAKSPQPATHGPHLQVFPLKMAACPRDNAFLGWYRGTCTSRPEINDGNQMFYGRIKFKWKQEKKRTKSLRADSRRRDIWMKMASSFFFPWNFQWNATFGHMKGAICLPLRRHFRFYCFTGNVEENDREHSFPTCHRWRGVPKNFCETFTASH